MAKKEPLYPHVPKSKLGAFMCGQCDARFHSMEALNKHLEKEHPEAFASVARVEVKAKYYYCDNTRLHSNNEVIQVKTEEENPKCPYCGAVMTYGRYWGPLLATVPPLKL